MKTTKLFAVTLSFVLLASACGGDNNDNASDSDDQANTTTTTTVAGALLEPDVPDTTTTVAVSTTTTMSTNQDQDMLMLDTETPEPNETENELAEVSDADFVLSTSGVNLARRMRRWFNDYPFAVEMVAESDNESVVYETEDFMVYGALGGMIQSEDMFHSFLRCAHTNILAAFGVGPLSEAEQTRISEARLEYERQWRQIDTPSDHADFMAREGGPLSSQERDMIVEATSECLEPQMANMLLATEPDFGCFAGLSTEQHLGLASNSIRYTFFPEYPTVVDMIGVVRSVCKDALIEQSKPALKTQMAFQLGGMGLTEEQKECMVSEYATLLVEEAETVYLDEENSELEQQIVNIFNICVPE